MAPVLRAIAIRSSSRCPEKDRYPSVADLGGGYKRMLQDSQKPIGLFYGKQWHHNGSKNNICSYPKPNFSHHWSHTKIITIVVTSPSSGTQMSFQQLRKYKKSKQRNFLTLRDWGNVISNCNDKWIFLLHLHLYFECSMAFCTPVTSSHIH